MIVERVITIEYLDPSMSRDLLCKFPDDSAFGFDYTQSGIWSPLIPRGSFRPDSENRKFKKKNKKKGSSALKKKRLNFSPVPSPKRGWRRMLRAAAKSFKGPRRSALQMMLPTL